MSHIAWPSLAITFAVIKWAGDEGIAPRLSLPFQYCEATRADGTPATRRHRLVLTTLS